MTLYQDQTKSVLRRDSGLQGFVDILVFLIPCLRFIQVRIVGRLSGSDILVALVFLCLALRLRIRIETLAGKVLLFLCTLWLVSQCVTDIVRHSAFADYARGWSNIGMTIAYLAVLWTLLYGRPERIAIYGWGLVTGSFLTFFINPSEAMTSFPWKFGIANPLTLAIFLLISRKEFRSNVAIAGSFAAGIMNIVMGSRSVGGVCLIAAIYLLATVQLRRRGTGSAKISARTMIAIAISVIVGVFGILWLYGKAAGNGSLGEDARAKYEQQSAGRYGIILGGRMDVLGAFFAIYDSPILGHGSWAKDPTYLLEQQQALALMDYQVENDVTPEELEEGLIPSHSYILGAWVDAGILGALFWGAAGYLVVKRLARVHPPAVSLLPVISFLAISLLWDIMFSPYGSEIRIIAPFYLVAVMSCLGTTVPALGREVIAKHRGPVNPTLEDASLGHSAQA